MNYAPESVSQKSRTPAPKYLIAVVCLLLLAGLFFLFTSSKNQVPSFSYNPPSFSCDPGSESVVENIQYLEPYNYSTVIEGDIIFDVIKAERDAYEWIYEDIWEVCDAPVTLIGSMNNSSLPYDRIVYQGKTYKLPKGAKPLATINNKIAYKTGSFGTTTIDGVTYDLTNVTSHVYSAGDKIISVRAQSTDLGSTVTYEGKELGPYERIFSEVRLIDNKPAFIAMDGQTIGSYPKTVMIHGDKSISNKYDYVGRGNGWDGSFVDLGGEPAYIIATGPAYVWQSEASVPIQQKVEYQIIWKDKPISKKYPMISGLHTYSGKLAFMASEDDKKFEKFIIIYDNKEYGTNCDNAILLKEVQDESFYYLCVLKDEQGLKFDLIADDKIVDTFVDPSYGGLSKNLFTIHDSKFVTAVSKNDSSSYIRYGNKKLLSGYGVSFVGNIDGKLVIKASKERHDYVFIQR